MTPQELSPMPFELYVPTSEYGEVTLTKNVADETYEINDKSGNFFGEIDIEDVLKIQRISDLGILVEETINSFISNGKPAYGFTGKPVKKPMCTEGEYSLYIIAVLAAGKAMGSKSQLLREMSGLSNDKFDDITNNLDAYMKAYPEMTANQAAIAEAIANGSNVL